jgi:ABC-type sugar transport system substrate-binding protein
MKRNTLIICLCLLGQLGLLASTGNALAKEKIAWFKSGSNSKFWPIVEQIMVSAANDLELDLNIYEYNNDPFYMITLVKEVLADENSRPDCILIHNFL